MIGIVGSPEAAGFDIPFSAEHASPNGSKFLSALICIAEQPKKVEVHCRAGFRRSVQVSDARCIWEIYTKSAIAHASLDALRNGQLTRSDLSCAHCLLRNFRQRTAGFGFELSQICYETNVGKAIYYSGGTTANIGYFKRQLFIIPVLCKIHILQYQSRAVLSKELKPSDLFLFLQNVCLLKQNGGLSFSSTSEGVHSIGGTLSFRSRILQVANLGAGSLCSFERGVRSCARGSVGSHQEVSLPHTRDGQTGSEDGKEQRVQSNRVSGIPPGEPRTLMCAALVGALVTATILGVATLFGGPHFESKSPGKNQKGGDRQKPS